MTSSTSPRIAVIGAGPLGIAAGRELLAKGLDNFTLFEKAGAAGGTWHQHSYPGLACDVPAHVYTFTEAPNPGWSANFVTQPEIEAYLQRCVREFGLEPHMRYDTEITSARYREPGEWLLTTGAGEEAVFDFVIGAMGNQHTAIWPDIEGIADFEGESWHSTHWDHSVDLSGKRVAVVGSAAAAVQVVPEIARQAGHLYVFQRTPSWILPRGKRDYSGFTLGLLRRLPLLARGIRRFQGKLLGFMHEGSLMGHKRMATFEKMGRQFLERAVDDPATRAALQPSGHFGCLRPLISDDFYPAMNRDNVSLVPHAAARVRPAGLTAASGEDFDVDVIIYCTGYRVLDFDRIEVRGEGDHLLGEALGQTPQAYKAVAVPGFPNFFFGMGPNGIVQSASYFASAETNVRCIVRLITEMQNNGYRRVVANPDRSTEYNNWLAGRFQDFSWGHSSCHSYYKTADGGSPFLYPGNFSTFRAQQAACTLAEFDCA